MINWLPALACQQTVEYRGTTNRPSQIKLILTKSIDIVNLIPPDHIISFLIISACMLLLLGRLSCSRYLPIYHDQNSLPLRMYQCLEYLSMSPSISKVVSTLFHRDHYDYYVRPVSNIQYPNIKSFKSCVMYVHPNRRPSRVRMNPGGFFYSSPVGTVTALLSMYHD